jgi:hypothetical protein
MPPKDYSCERHAYLLERVEHLIEGNGKPPLDVRLDRIEQLVVVVRWLIGAVVIETLALGGNIVLWLVTKQ